MNFYDALHMVAKAEAEVRLDRLVEFFNGGTPKMDRLPTVKLVAVTHKEHLVGYAVEVEGRPTVG